MEKVRYIALTDIEEGIEVDDIQSMVRLLLYANDIDIEGLIATTSCYVRHTGAENAAVIHRIIDTYEQVKANLDVHAAGYPDGAYLHSVTAWGVPCFGAAAGDGFADPQYADNAGVRRILEAADKQDDRPLWIGLWGGANTLAQAVWTAQQTRTAADFEKFLAKLRIYGIADQDAAGHWLRREFGDRLFYIVSPCAGEEKGNQTYYKGTWPGISADRNDHGSVDGKTRSMGFTGGEFDLINRTWVEENVRSKKPYGTLYPLPSFIVEGDSPSFLGVIPNGLNVPEHPEYGGWGGRYEKYLPPMEQFGTDERHPIYTNAWDTVLGADGKVYTSPQATIWRWRRDFQADFLMRLEWTVTPLRGDAVHPPEAVLVPYPAAVQAGERVTLSAADSRSVDGDALQFQWFCYPEAGTCPDGVRLEGEGAAVTFTAPQTAGTLHIICRVTGGGKLPAARYLRAVVTVQA